MSISGGGHSLPEAWPDVHAATGDEDVNNHWQGTNVTAITP